VKRANPDLYSSLTINILVILALTVRSRHAVFQPATAPNRTPNVVVILADDLGYGDVSCYGAVKVRNRTLTVWLPKDAGLLTPIPLPPSARHSLCTDDRAVLLADFAAAPGAGLHRAAAH